MRGLQKFVPLGGLNTDTDPIYLRDGEYRDALNVQHLTNSTGSTQSIIPMKGNTEAFDIGSISAQNKTYRIYTTVTVAASTATMVFYQNGNQFGYPNAFWQNFFTVTWNQQQPLAAQASDITAAITAWAASVQSTVSVGTNYIDITLTQVTGGEYTIAVTDAAGDVIQTNVVQEAFDTNMAGELQPIKSYDLLGDLYVWSTTGTSLPVKANLTVSSVALVVTGLVTTYQITFASAHGLSAGQSVNLVGDISTILDGTWIVNSLGFSSTAIALSTWSIQTALPAVNPATMLVTSYDESIGEIGVAQYTASSDTWGYVRIARTKQWGFRLEKQIDAYCEQNSVKSSAYWTDDFNVPRCIYYPFEYSVNNVKQPFEQDGIITPINSTGLYTYETIDSESKLQLTSSGARVAFVQQLQAGGAVLSGNWRYTVRFLTEGLTGTEFTDLTNPINVCLADLNGDPALIIGDEPDTVTGKINQLSVTGIIPGLFKYVELIGVNYVGGGIAGYNIKRIELSNTQASITINHLGNETSTTDFDLGLIGQVFEEIATAKNIDVIDKRMILSNLTTKERIDFTNWAQLFTHRLQYESIDSVRGATQGTYRMAEYMDPVNVNGYVGYMQNETYRFGVKVRFKDGGWSDVFHIDDICFTTFATNLNPNSIAVSSDPTRRTAGLPDLDITDATGVTTTVYVPYVTFGNIDIEYKIGGVAVRDLVDEISIERVECVPEVLSSGVGVLSIYGSAYINAANANAWVVSSAYPATNPYGGTANQLVEYPFVSGRDGIAGAPDNPVYPNNTATFGDNMNANRRFMAFYSSDIFFGNTSFSYASGDSIINYGAPVHLAFNNGVSGGTLPYSGFAQYSGNEGVDNSLVQIITPTDVVSMATGASTTVGAITFTKANPVSDSTGAGASGYANSVFGYLFVTGSDMLNPGSPTDYGLRYVQYYRQLTDKYGDIENNTYISCGAYTTILNTTASVITVDVFGGDVFTQLNYLKHRYVADLQDGLAGGLSFYSQNRVNAQMKQKSASQTGDLYPGIATQTWLESSADTDGTNGEAYQEGYTIRNEVKSDVAFNEDATDTTDQPARIRWSAIKPQGSASDQYRVYLPLDYHDLDQSNGEIVHHANANGELITWQQRAFMRQYFNTRGTLEVKGITEILIGDGSVMSRDGVTVSRLGSKHKWSIIKGKSTGGNDVFYWINTELKKGLRFGYDGTVSVSDIKGMQSYFANNLTWVDGYDTPANGTGICGVWDDRYANAVWVVRAVRPVAAWSNIGIYSAGDAVSYTPTTYSTFNKTGEIYISIDPGFNSGNTPDTTPAKWEVVPHTNNTYYNEYSLIFNEFKNAFTTFTTPLAKIFLKWTDTYLAPRPISPEYKVYQFNKGDYLTWWEDGGVSQQEQGYLQFVVNDMPDETKWMEAVGVDSEIVPTRFEFETKTQESFLTSSEFLTREDSSYAPVKRDSTTTGLNDGDTSALYGKYMLAKMFFAVDTYQKLVSVITKFRVSPRLKTK